MMPRGNGCAAPVIKSPGHLYVLMVCLCCITSFNGCASTQTAVPVRVQVSVPCITQDQLPAKPQISADADLLKLSDGDLILTIAGERIALKSYAGEMDALIQACVKP